MDLQVQPFVFSPGITLAPVVDLFVKSTPTAPVGESGIFRVLEGEGVFFLTSPVAAFRGQTVSRRVREPDLLAARSTPPCTAKRLCEDDGVRLWGGDTPCGRGKFAWIGVLTLLGGWKVRYCCGRASEKASPGSAVGRCSPVRSRGLA